MKNFALLLLVSLVAIGCSDSAEPDTTQPLYTGPIMPLKVGNYWAYLGKIYNPSGRIDEYQDTLTVTSDTTFYGHAGFNVLEKSIGMDRFIYYYDGDSLCYAVAGSPLYAVLATYPMTEGAQLIVTDASVPTSVTTLHLDSLKTNLDLGFEKFYALKYRKTYVSGTDTTTEINYYAPGTGWLKEEFYDSSGKILSSRELVGYVVTK